MTVRIIHADCREALCELPDSSVDAVVTDPPAGISFMGKDWDNPNTFPVRRRDREPSHGARAKDGPTMGFGRGIEIRAGKREREAFIAFMTEVFTDVLRVTKPGGHALVWALPRTSHWTATALEDAGWEMRDRIAHVFGSGFPKSLDVSKAIDKTAGAERQVIGSYKATGTARTLTGGNYGGGGVNVIVRDQIYQTAPATFDAAHWDGWGTALKPAVEDWWLCRKPLSEPTVAANVLRWGTGAVNVDACRVEHDGRGSWGGANVATDRKSGQVFGVYANNGSKRNAAGRWPANLILSHTLFCDATGCADGCPVAMLDRQSGRSKSTGGRIRSGTTGVSGIYGRDACVEVGDPGYGDSGGASRFFPTFCYQAKAGRAERHGSKHPTVKPLALMRWLARLVTPLGGTVLDPFAGSGTTAEACLLEGFGCIAIEQEAEYVADIERRLAAPA